MKGSEKWKLSDMKEFAIDNKIPGRYNIRDKEIYTKTIIKWMNDMEKNKKVFNKPQWMIDIEIENERIENVVKERAEKIKKREEKKLIQEKELLSVVKDEEVVLETKVTANTTEDIKEEGEKKPNCFFTCMSGIKSYIKNIGKVDEKMAFILESLESSMDHTKAKRFYSCINTRSLKTILIKYNLPYKGNKKELFHRVVEHFKTDVASKIVDELKRKQLNKIHKVLNAKKYTTTDLALKTNIINFFKYDMEKTKEKLILKENKKEECKIKKQDAIEELKKEIKDEYTEQFYNIVKEEKIDNMMAVKGVKFLRNRNKKYLKFIDFVKSFNGEFLMGVIERLGIEYLIKLQKKLCIPCEDITELPKLIYNFLKK